MGCEGSQMDGGVALPRKRPTVSQEAVKLIALGQYDSAETIADGFFGEGRITEAIQVYQKIIEANYVHEYEIQGVGCSELATSRYEWFIYKWYSQGRQAGRIKGNPYDGLSLCYCQLFLKDKMDHELKEGVQWYQEMLGEVESYSLYMGYANILYNLERYEAAVKIYQKVIDLKPTLLNAYVCIALTYQYKRVQKPKAVDFAKKVIAIDPENMYGLFILAKNEGSVDQKITKLKAIHQKIPEYVRATNQIGIAYGGGKKDHKQAIVWYSKCVERAPDYSSAIRNVGANLQMQKLYPEALVWYFRACVKNPSYKVPYEDARDIFNTLSYTDEQIEEEMRKYPALNRFEFYFNLGSAYFKDKKVETALKWYWKAAAIHSNSFLLENSMGIAYDEIKDYPNAEKHYNRCISLNPEHYSAYYNLGILHKNQGNLQKAIELYRKAVALHPTYSYAYNNLGNIYKNRQDFPNAIEAFKKAVQGNSTYSLALTNLGICYLVTHRYRDAFEVFFRAKEALPNDNNHLSEGNKAFLKENLEVFDKEGEKWRSNGEVNSQQKGLLQSLVKTFEQKFGHSPSDPSSSPTLKPEVLMVIRLIHEDQFQLKKTLQIFEIIKILFKQDEEQFHILPLIMIQYFETNTLGNKRPFTEVQNDLKKILSQIMAKEAGEGLSPTKSPHATTIKLKHYTPPDTPLPNTASNLITYESLSAQILKVNDAAVKNLSEFVDLVQDVRKRSNGIEFVTRMRIPRYQTQQFRALLLITQQIFKEELTPEKSAQIRSKMAAEVAKGGPRAPLQTTLTAISSIWSKEVSGFLSERSKKKQAIQLPLGDLVKGKVRFNSVEELSRALEVVDNICFLRKYSIIGLLNRLTVREFKDVTLSIKIHDSVYVLRFTLSHSEIAHNLHDSLQEIEASAIGCALGSYLFMSQGFSYPLTLVCQDVETELAGKEGAEEKRNLEAAKFIRTALGEKQA